MHDIGLIYVRKAWQSYVGTNQPYGTIASDTPEFEHWLDVYGLGYADNLYPPVIDLLEED
jgi:hypothetical protein